MAREKTYPEDPVGLAARLGRNVRRLRDAAGLSQAQLAEAAGIDAASLSRLENAKRVGDEGIGTARIARLAAALKVDPSTLLQA